MRRALIALSVIGCLATALAAGGFGNPVPVKRDQHDTSAPMDVSDDSHAVYAVMAQPLSPLELPAGGTAAAGEFARSDALPVSQPTAATASSSPSSFRFALISPGPSSGACVVRN